MSVVLVNGDGNPAVYASQDADFIGGISGQETGILDINDKFAATIADANTVEISSGVLITKEGRRVQIDVGAVEEVIVPTGSQGTTKYYIIGFHLYTDGSGNQLAETFIDEVASPSATITEKMFKDGETEVYVSLYRITRNGLNLEGLTLILPEIGSLAGGGIIGDTDISGIADGTVTGAIAQINTDLSDIDDMVDDLATTRSKLGAKNLLPYPYYNTTRTVNGVTFTDNGDGTIILNGTSTEANTTFMCHFRNKSETVELLSRLKKMNTSFKLFGGVNNPLGKLIVDFYDSSNTYISSVINMNDTPTVFTIPSNAEFMDVFIRCGKNMTYSDLTIYPMLYLASITDDTYEPYAMTNKELTKNVVEINTDLSDLVISREYQLTSSSWTSNPDTTTNAALPYIYTIVTSNYRDTSTPVWDVVGASGIPTSASELTNIGRIQYALFSSSGITLYATSAPSVNLTLRVRGN